MKKVFFKDEKVRRASSIKIKNLYVGADLLELLQRGKKISFLIS